MSVCVVIRGESFRQIGKQHNRNTNDDPTLQMKCSASHKNISFDLYKKCTRTYT